MINSNNSFDKFQNDQKRIRIILAKENSLETEQKKQALDWFQRIDSDTNGKITLKELMASKHPLITRIDGKC